VTARARNESLATLTPSPRYEVGLETATGELRAADWPRLFETSYSPPQPRLVALRVLGKGGWLKAMRLEGYAPRAPRRPWALQEALFLT
jgi:hypothetical protein